MKLKKRYYALIILGIVLGYFILNSIRIYHYSFTYFEIKSDVAIVLGAGTNNGKVSPIFKERINHSILLYNKKLVTKIVFTGGYGIDQKLSDSQAAKNYALRNGVPESDIIIEEKSKITLENLSESKKLMDSLGLETALIISDPLHMKRAIKLAHINKIDCLPSPTKTSMYKSFYTQTNQLIYETFYFSIREVICLF